MRSRLLHAMRRTTSACALGMALGFTLSATAQTGASDDLRARYAALAPQLASSPFQRPLHLESSESSGSLRGDVYAVVEHPFAAVSASLGKSERWCDILSLHPNVKQCRASGQTLAVNLGKKSEQSADDAYGVEFGFQSRHHSADRLELLMRADTGPLGTKDYRIALEAIPIDARRSFIHMGYSYGYGFAARVAMQGYLGTLGRDKVGFSVVERRGDGSPVYVGGVRGAVERNAMRYFLAIEAYLGALSAPPPERLERRLRDWLAATERYPLQLRETRQQDYLALKREEARR